MTTILITGANRGIGLEHVRQALASGETVIAACRQPAKALELARLAAAEPSRLRIEALDVTSPSSVEALAARLEGAPIDVLINNAGVYSAPETPSFPEGAKVQSLEGMDYDLWETVLRINLLGPFRVTAALLPNLMAGKRKLVAMMSSDLASISGNTLGTSHAYRTSKAALNMVTRGLAIELKDRGVTVVALTPGWTKTDLGGDGAQWSVEDSVAGQRRVIVALGVDDSGQFIDLTGKRVAW